MENEKRIVELLSEMLVRQDLMVDEIRGVKGEVVKLNLQTTENTRAIFKLANEVEKIADLHDRVSKLEKAVYK